MYRFYLGKTLLPIPPEKLKISINGSNKTYKLISSEEINILKQPGLSDITFDALLPNSRYPFAQYKRYFHRAAFYLDKLRSLKENNSKFQFIVTRELANGTFLYDTNFTVTLEEYDITEDAKNGFDVKVSIKLKQYKPYGTEIVSVTDKSSSTKKIAKRKKRDSSNSPMPSGNTAKKYTVKDGDCLWKIAKYFYGDGSKYTVILNANSAIKSANLIYKGQILTIPSL